MFWSIYSNGALLGETLDRPSDNSLWLGSLQWGWRGNITTTLLILLWWITVYDFLKKSSVTAGMYLPEFIQAIAMLSRPSGVGVEQQWEWGGPHSASYQSCFEAQFSWHGHHCPGWHLEPSSEFTEKQKHLVFKTYLFNFLKIDRRVLLQLRLQWYN